MLNRIKDIKTISVIKTTPVFLLFIFLLLTVASCSYFKNEKNNDVIARVFDQKLFKDDIIALVPKGSSSKDSITIIKNYVDSWIRQKLILHKAEANISDQTVFDEIDKKLDDYKNSLITYSYERELVRQKLDTLITDKEIEKYYVENQDNFTLKDNIIKVVYLKIKKNSPKLDKIKSWYKSENSKDKLLLEEYCHQYAINFFLDDNTWLLFDDLLKEIPIKTYDKEQFLKNNRFIEIQDSSGFYFVNIKGFKIKESLSPLSFEKENIRNMILNRRKHALIGEMEKSTWNDALNNKDFEIFIK